MYQYKMTKYINVNVSLSSSHLDEIKVAQKKCKKLSLNMTGNATDENYFPHKLLLPDRQVSKLCNAFA